MLYSILHSSMITCASNSVENSSMLSSSSRARPLNDSINGFSHGDPAKSLSVCGFVQSMLITCLPMTCGTYAMHITMPVDPLVGDEPGSTTELCGSLETFQEDIGSIRGI